MLRVRLIVSDCEQIRYSPPREEAWLRHKEEAGEAHLSAADGVVAHKACFGVSDHPGRCASTPPHEEGITRIHSAHPAPCSKAAAMAKTRSSSQGRPTICTPIGRPSSERAIGTTAAGFPRRLNHCE